MTALPLLVVLAAGPTVQLTAEHLLHDDTRKITTAEGDAELVAKDSAMHADLITWDEKGDSATAHGHVALRLTRKGLMVVLADTVSVRMNGDDVEEVFIYEGIALRKRNVTPAVLLAANSQEAARKVGTTTMSMVATHLKRDGDGAWVTENIDITPCECDFDKPSWRIGASHTTVNTEAERASLMFPVVYVFDVPVLWFPWMSMPLNDRQTGILVPHPTFTALSGLYIDAPVFITLGRSADLTLTPSYYGGRHGVYGVRGPQLFAEFRYATSPATNGRMTLGLLYDTRPARDPNDPTLGSDGQPLYPTVGDTPKEPYRGLRAQGSWQHTQTIGAGWYDRVNAAFLSDGYMNRDFTADVLAREAGYLRSTATLFHKGDDHFIGIDAVVRQDLSTGYSIFSNGGPNPFQRMPGLTFAVPNKVIAGPVAVSISAEAVRLAPTLYQTDGVYDPALGARIYQAGDREARDRLDVMPRVSAAGALGGILGVSAFAAWRQDVWMTEITKTPSERGYALVGARADTEVGRNFGATLRHTIAPSLEVRAVPYVVGLAPTPYDEIDAAIPDNLPHVQAVAQLRQRLLHKEGATVREWLRLDLGQGADLLTPRLGESFARISTSFWLARATGTVRVDPVLARVTRVSAQLAVDDNRGTGLYFAYENLLDDGTDRSRQPVDLLIGPSVVAPTKGRPQIITCGLHWRLGGFGARYDAIFQQTPGFFPPPPGGQAITDPRVAPTQQTVGLSYGPACNCWRAEAYATYRGQGFPDIGFSLTISGFGTLGTGG